MSSEEWLTPLHIRDVVSDANARPSPYRVRPSLPPSPRRPIRVASNPSPRAPAQTPLPPPFVRLTPHPSPSHPPPPSPSPTRSPSSWLGFPSLARAATRTTSPS